MSESSGGQLQLRDHVGLLVSGTLALVVLLRVIFVAEGSYSTAWLLLQQSDPTHILFAAAVTYIGIVLPIAIYIAVHAWAAGDTDILPVRVHPYVAVSLVPLVIIFLSPVLLLIFLAGLLVNLISGFIMRSKLSKLRGDLAQAQADKEALSQIESSIEELQSRGAERIDPAQLDSILAQLSEIDNRAKAAPVNAPKAGRRSAMQYRLVTFVVLITLSMGFLILPLLIAPVWLPSEELRVGNAYVTGYVISEDDRDLLVLELDSQVVRYSRVDIRDRQYCETPDQRSRAPLAQSLLDGPRYPPCRNDDE